MVTFQGDPQWLTHCPFPKHQGEPWEDVVENDREYVHWILYESEMDLQDLLVTGGFDGGGLVMGYPFNLQDFQYEVRKWSNKNFGEDQPSILPLLGVAEEVGELNHAHLKGVQGIRYTDAEVEAKKADAVGDLMIYLADYCAREGLDLEDCVWNAWNEVKNRDWKENPMDAHKNA